MTSTDRFESLLATARRSDTHEPVWTWLALWRTLRTQDPGDQSVTRELEREAAVNVAQKSPAPFSPDDVRALCSRLPPEFTRFEAAKVRRLLIGEVSVSSAGQECAEVAEEIQRMSRQVTLDALLSHAAQTNTRSQTEQTSPHDKHTQASGTAEGVGKKRSSTARGRGRRSVSEESETAKPEQGSSFVTARTKLLEDHQKKFSKGSEAYKAPFLTRKTSGTGAKGKFAPPSAKEKTVEPETDTTVLSSRTRDVLCRGSGEIPQTLKNFDMGLLEAVCSEILDEGAAVQWTDIAGQETAKELVQEMVVWPMLNPHLFQGARAPPRGLLLFGPPGTGKTLIGRAIASNIQATFFSISASSLTSKWVGEGEKMVRILFAVAQALQPTVIFIDEIDSILSARKTDGEHESSRRIKTELLIQMDGCNPNLTSARILVVGATNRPQELDEAARRRLPKQLYIPLPCATARRTMICTLLRWAPAETGTEGSVRTLGSVNVDELTEADVEKIVEKTEGYSGADMRSLIQEACQGPIREAFKQRGTDISAISEKSLRSLRIKDFQAAKRAQKPSVNPAEIEQYEAYNERHGAKMADVQSASDEEW